MNNCKSCGKFMPKTRIHLGYKECVKCSTVEPYSAHIVYPHKTGGYVQPVDKKTKEHLQTLDRRAVKTGKKVRGGSSSWDRWVKNYQKQKGDVAQLGERRTCTAEVAGSTPVSSTQSAKDKAIDIYKKDGYWTALEKVNEMFKTGSITLMQKCNVTNHLTFIKMHNKKQQRLIMR